MEEDKEGNGEEKGGAEGLKEEQRGRKRAKRRRKREMYEKGGKGIGEMLKRSKEEGD